jgi:hypothetical protein
MKRAALLLASLLLGCSSSSSPVIDGHSPDQAKVDTAIDRAAPDLAKPDLPRPDKGKPDRGPSDASGSPSALQAVINTITLPTSGTDYAFDYDGSGAKNRLGTIVSVLNAAGLANMSFQANTDYMLAQGSFLMLLDVHAKSLTSDPSTSLPCWLGKDLDSPANPNDNFSGSEPLGIDSASPSNMTLPGSITSGKMKAGPGQLMIPLPMGTTPITVALKKAEVDADLSSTPLSTMTNGRMYGAIIWTDIDQKVIPAMANEVNHTYNDPLVDPATKTLLKTLFDLDGDKVITADELRNSAVLKLILAADVDTDGDKTPDAMSAGMAFTAVKCVIQ